MRTKTKTKTKTTKHKATTTQAAVEHRMARIGPALTFLVSLLVLSLFDRDAVAETYINASAYVRACVIGAMVVAVIALH